jgi:hypothetical protein
MTDEDKEEARKLASVLLVRAGCLMEDECSALVYDKGSGQSHTEINAKIERLTQVAVELAALAAGAAAVMRSERD